MDVGYGFTTTPKWAPNFTLFGVLKNYGLLTTLSITIFRLSRNTYLNTRLYNNLWKVKDEHFYMRMKYFKYFQGVRANRYRESCEVVCTIVCISRCQIISPQFLNLFPIYSWSSKDKKHSRLFHCSHHRKLSHSLQTWLLQLPLSPTHYKLLSSSCL